MLGIDIPETVKERVLNRLLWLKVAAVPRGASSLLDAVAAEVAVDGAVGMVNEYTMIGAPPVPIFPASGEVEALGGAKPAAGCVKE